MVVDAILCGVNLQLYIKWHTIRLKDARRTVRCLVVRSFAALNQSKYVLTLAVVPHASRRRVDNVVSLHPPTTPA